MYVNKRRALVEWLLCCGIDYVLAPEPQNLSSSVSSSGFIPSSATDYCLKDSQESGFSLPSSAPLLSSVSSLEALRAVLETFDSPLKKTALHLVFGEGNPHAEVMFVGEAPGADEDRLGRPFVGVSGHLLDKMLATIGLDRSQVYITNILPWRPPGNRTPTTEETALFLPFVRKHIALVEPRILCLVGGTAVKTLLARQDGIMCLRGKWFDYEGGISVLPTYHPAFLLRSPSRKKESWRDFLAIYKKLHSIA